MKLGKQNRWKTHKVLLECKKKRQFENSRRNQLSVTQQNHKNSLEKSTQNKEMKKKLTVKSLLFCWIFWIGVVNETHAGKLVENRKSVVVIGKLFPLPIIADSSLRKTSLSIACTITAKI
jgi:hypothetical protein